MLYQEYRNKMTKLAGVLGVIKRFRVLIICAVAVILATAATLMGISGMVNDVNDCPSEIVYGQELTYSAKAIFKKITYEYSVEGSEEWTNIAPTQAGSYKVRAVSRNILGKPRYGKAHSFSVVPKQTEIYVDGTVVYGGLPSVYAELSYGDTVTCSHFIYDSFTSPETNVAADIDAITVTDINGNDVTASYLFKAEKCPIKFTGSKVSIIVQNAQFVYDGEAHGSESYVIDEQTPLHNGDYVEATFSHQRTDAGETSNLPQIKLFGANGEENENYIVNVEAGTIKILPRTVNVTTYGGSWVYNGEAHSNHLYDYDIAEFLDGHDITPVAYTQITDANEQGVANDITFKVTGSATGENGDDLNENYNIKLNPGLLIVQKRPVKVTTYGKQWTYDGNGHSFHQNGSETAYEYEEYNAALERGVLVGHGVSVGSYAYIPEFGSITNEINLKITYGGADLTSNYRFENDFGTISVVKRKVKIFTGNNTWEYDGTEHTETGKIEDMPDIDHLPIVGGHLYVADKNLNITSVKTVAEAGSGKANEFSVKIVDSFGTDKSEYYTVDYSYGTLTINSRFVTITADSAERDYNGRYLTANSFTVTSGSIAPSHVVTAFTINSEACRIIDYGECQNVIQNNSVVISDNEGNNVTENYTVTLAEGTLKVKKRSVTITAGSATKVYDGTALRYALGVLDGATSYVEPRLEGGVNGHYVKELTSASKIVREGSVDNVINTVEIYGADESSSVERDVTHNYELYFLRGLLTVTKRPISIAAGDAQKIYDGIELTYEYSNGFVNSSGVATFPVILGEAGNHRVMQFRSLSSITDYGAVPNEIDINSVYIIGTDDDSVFGNEDLTSNYEISLFAGELRVDKRPVTVSTGSQELVYNGLNQSHQSCYISANSQNDLVYGEELVVDTFTQIAAVWQGEVDNELTVKVYNGEADKSGNYEITYEYGKIKITQATLTVTAGSATKVYDGTALRYTFGVLEGVTSYTEPRLDGAVEGHYISMLTVTEGSYQIWVGTCFNWIESIQIYGADGSREGEYGVTVNYNLTFVRGNLEVTKRPITIKAGSAQKVYDGTPLTYAFGEAPSGVTVTEEPYIYSGAPQNAGVTVRIQSLETYSSQTAYYEGENGITPNRICADRVKLMGTDEGSVTEIWVTDNYDITLLDGALRIIKRPITVTAGSAQKTYDGAPLTYAFGIPSGLSLYTEPNISGQLDGHVLTSVTCTDNSTVTHARISVDNVVQSIIIMGKDATHVDNYDVTVNYEPEFINGELYVNPRLITVTPALTKVYDGSTYTQNYVVSNLGYGGDGVTSGLLIGDSIVAQTETEKINADIADQSDKTKPLCVKNLGGVWQVTVYDIDSNDITSDYLIVCSEGTITITLRPITVLTGTMQWTYDGDPHTYDYAGDATSSFITNAGLVSGHEFSAIQSTLTQITNVSETEKDNEFEVDILSDGERVTFNYLITYTYGKLSILKREIHITSHDQSWVYDGIAHEYNEFGTGYTCDIAREDNVLGLLTNKGHKTEIIWNATVTTVYENGVDDSGVENKILIRIRDALNADISDNYNIIYTYTWGTIKITPRPVTVGTDDCSFVYNGQARDCALVSDLTLGIENKGLISGHDFNILESSITKVVRVMYDENGEITGTPNALTVSIKDDFNSDVTSNYHITYEFGTLTVTKLTITVTAGSAQKVYDGTPLKYTLGADAGEGVTVNVLPSITGVPVGSGLNYYIDYLDTNTEITAYTQGIEGEIANKIIAGSVVILGTDESSVQYYNATSNFNIELSDGVLKLTKRPVTLTPADSKIYDATHNTNNKVVVGGEYGLVEGHSVTALTRTEAINVADVNIPVWIPDGSVEISDSSGASVLGNYQVTTQEGRIVINPRPLYITTGSHTWVYDGEEHAFITEIDGSAPFTCAPLTDTSGLILLFEHRLIIDSTTGNYTTVKNVTPVGGVENELQFIVCDRGGIDVTANYEITEHITYGTLNVNKRLITFITYDKEWTYDALPHSYYIYTDAEKAYFYNTQSGSVGLVNGHTVEVNTYSEITDYVNGGIPNAITFTINDGPDDVTYNYDTESDVTYGTLTILKRTLIITTCSYTWGYDGNYHSFTQVIDGNEPFTYNSQLGNSGLITGHDISVNDGSFVPIKNVTPVEGVSNIFTVSVTSGGEDVTNNYSIGYNCTGKLKITAREITVKPKPVTKTYDDTADITVDNSNVTDNALTYESGDLAQDHKALVTIVSNDINVTLSGVLRVGTLQILDESDQDVTTNYAVTYQDGVLVIEARVISIETFGKHFTYNGEYHSFTEYNDTEKAYAYDEQTQNAGLITGHSIAADTLSATKVKNYVSGGEDNVLSFIITDSLGYNVTGNYSINVTAYGKLIIDRREITVETGSKTVSSGTLTYEHSDITAGSLVDGQVFTATYTGVQSGPGASFNTIVDYTVTDPTDGDVGYNYIIKLYEGILTVDKAKLVLNLTFIDQSQKTYDDSTDVNDYVNVQIDFAASSEVFASAELVSASVASASKYVGLRACVVLSDSVSVSASDTQCNPASFEYDISYNSLNINILKRDITVKAGTATKEYTGYVIKHDVSEVQNLVAGHRVLTDSLSYSHNGATVIIPGTYDNIVSVDGIVIKDALSNDVTSNYNVSTQDGEINVIKRKINVFAVNTSEQYNTSAHICNYSWVPTGDTTGFNAGEFNVVASTANVDGLVMKNVGAYYCNVSSLSAVKRGGADVTEYFECTLNPGDSTAIMEITPIPIVITAGSKEFVYDGGQYSWREIEPGERYTVDYLPYGIITEVTFDPSSKTRKGTVANIITGCTIMLGAEDITANYDITYLPGVITVTK